MYIASMKGHDGIVERLIGASAALDTADTKKCTPLFIATQEALETDGGVGRTTHDNIIKMLVAAGASLDLRNLKGARELVGFCVWLSDCGV